MASSHGLKPFRRVRKRLKELGIIWNPTSGKGSHGSFIGPNQKTGSLNAFPLPRSQQREINADYLSAIRRRFGLIGKDWNDFFD